MIKQKIQKNKGFTIIEAMIAIFILTVSVASLLGITASSAASARYANNEITANYLLQEAVDSIRNSRDTLAFQGDDGNDTTNLEWDNFLKRYGYPNSKCFTTNNGCILIMEDFDPTDIEGKDTSVCGSGGCDYLNYDDSASKLFYNYNTVLRATASSPFKRTVNMEIVNNNENQVKVTAKVEWFNGDSTTLRKQELVTYLLNWQK